MLTFLPPIRLPPLQVVYSGNGIDRNATGAYAFQAQLYGAGLGQALEMAADITARRSKNAFGTIVWQVSGTRGVWLGRLGGGCVRG
jgi:hypothetical protein